MSKRLGSPYVSGRSRHGLKKNPAAPAVQREADEEWGKSDDDKREAFRKMKGASRRVLAVAHPP